MNKTSAARNDGSILLVANYRSDVGYAWWLMENFWAEIAGLFTAQNRKVFLVYPEIGTIPAKIRESDIQIFKNDFADSSKASRKKLKQLIRKNNIRSIYLTDKPYLSPFYLLLRMWGIREIVLHDHTPGDRTPQPLLKRLFKRMIHHFRLFSCDHYIGVSRFVYNRFIKIGCLPAARCCYVLNGIRPIVVDDKYRYYANEQFGIPEGSTIVVTTGRATYYKGIDVILKCANIVINDHNRRNVYFLHCGDGPDLETFKSMAYDLHIAERFLFAGRRSDINTILPSCHIGIQASLGEAFSLSILEYLSAGLATIVPNNSGNPEAIEDNVNGFLYPTGDVGTAAALIERLIDDKTLRLRIGTAALQSVNKRFNIQRMNQDFRAIITNCL